MKALKGIKFTIQPDKEQENFFARVLGCQRFVWNYFLQCNMLKHMFTGHFVFYNEMANSLPALKEKHPWLKEIPSQTLQQTLKDLERAIKASFELGFGFPKFKSRNSGSDSARFPQGFVVMDGFIKLPKTHPVKFMNRNSIDQKDIRNITLSRDNLTGRYTVSLCFRDETEIFSETGKSLGLDMGSVRLFTDSDGNFVDAIRNIPVVKKLLERIEHEQRKLSGIRERFKSGEQVEKLLKRKRKTVGVLHRKLADFVRDLLHKLSINIVRNNDLVIVEDLKIKNMTKSAKGTEEEPGKNVKQKSGLNRNLLSNRISMFFGMLEYKCRWHGRSFVKIDPKYTSQRCSACGYVDKNNRPDQARFKCLKCGHEMNADHNAAINILKSGIFPLSGVSKGACPLRGGVQGVSP